MTTSSPTTVKNSSENLKNDFIRTIIREDLQQGKHNNVVTRFPPEPNGYLHLGHVKAICTNFGIAEDFNGKCNLRFDDTNPTKEEQTFIDNIKADVQWLGFNWAGEHHASDYFDQLYTWAVQLIEQGDAYVDLQTPEQMKQNRGSFNEAGVNSPYRDTPVAQNLALFDDMKKGNYANGEAVLRAKIDMASPNMNLRDPAIYRVMHAHHHQTGDNWCIYPMYDYAHPLSDAIEGITHSLCTLEFEDHRPFYDWVIDKLGLKNPPHQYEFSRLNVDYLLTSKRKLKQLVDENIVSGWDDPRMPTIAGMRRRGYTPAGLRDFCDRVGLNKSDGVVDYGMLTFCVRNALESTAPRGMAVLNPLKVTLTNFADIATAIAPERTLEDDVLWLTQPCHPNVPELGERCIPFTDTIYIDKSDFETTPPKGFKRLIPEGEVRLRNSFIIKCDSVVYNDTGEIIELKASIDVNTLGKKPEGRKVKGVIHWVSASLGVPATVRLYEQLFSHADPASSVDVHEVLNPNSLTVVNAIVEPSLAQATPESQFQFEREGYFVADRYDHSMSNPVFNQIVSLRDSYKPS